MRQASRWIGVLALAVALGGCLEDGTGSGIADSGLGGPLGFDVEDARYVLGSYVDGGVDPVDADLYLASYPLGCPVLIQDGGSLAHLGLEGGGAALAAGSFPVSLSGASDGEASAQIISWHVLWPDGGDVRATPAEDAGSTLTILNVDADGGMVLGFDLVLTAGFQPSVVVGRVTAQRCLP